MPKAIGLLLICALVLLPRTSLAGARFDGKWLTTVTCPAIRMTEAYKIQLPGLVKDGNFRGEYGTAGEPGYLLIEGKIADDGTAKLSAAGKVSSRDYGVGLFTTRGRDYSYDITSQFKDTVGTGTRSEGRPCTFDFVKQ